MRHRPADLPAVLGERGGPLIRRLAELLRAIEQGRRSCSPSNLDLLAAHERLERLGRPLNAVCSVIGAPDRARDRAAGRAPGRRQGHHRGGRRADPLRQPGQRSRPAAADAVLVRRLREAGAEVFATTQCLEYAAGFAHPEVGDTRNPRDPSRTSGGSSGGSAALVAAGVCDLALGTDTGGSVRSRPPTAGSSGSSRATGSLPLEGVFPLSPSCDHAGTLTATVAGAADLLAVLAGPPAGTGRQGQARPGRGRRLHRRRPRAQLSRPVGHAAGPRRRPLRAGRARRGRMADQGADRALARPAGQLGRVLAVIVAREAYLVHSTGTPAATPRARGRCWSSARRSAMASTPVRSAAGPNSPPRSRRAWRMSTSWPGPPSATRHRNRTRRSGPARTTGRAGSPARTTSAAIRRCHFPSRRRPPGRPAAGRAPRCRRGPAPGGRGGRAPDRGTAPANEGLAKEGPTHAHDNAPPHAHAGRPEVPVIEVTGDRGRPAAHRAGRSARLRVRVDGRVRRWASEPGGTRPARPRRRGTGAEPAGVPRPHPVPGPRRRQEPQPVLPRRPGGQRSPTGSRTTRSPS